MESTLDVEQLLELHAGLRFVNAGDKVVDPLFGRTVHLVGSCVGLVKGTDDMPTETPGKTEDDPEDKQREKQQKNREFRSGR